MKKTIIYLLFFFAFFGSNAQTLTWSENAAPIFYSNCVKCHNPNGVAPFELLTYNSANTYKNLIKYMVSERKMPPWTPNPHYTRFVDERILRQGEIDTIVKWVNDGALEGDVSKAPNPPVFSNKNEITNPDLTLKIPDYTVTTITDKYRCFVVPYSIGTDKFITDFEIVPGNKPAVHHVLLFHDNTSIPDSLDALDTEPGYSCFGGTGSNSSTLIGGWVPGQQVQHLPSGIGIKLPNKAKAILQIHYPAGKTDELDSTKVLIKYTANTLRNLYSFPLLNHSSTLTNGPLFIPANTIKTFNAKYLAPFAGSLLQIAPHMHLIGKSIKVFCVTPLKDTLPLIEIPQWDFHWQGFYTFPSLIKIPAGSTLYSEAVYDNTHANEHHPNHAGIIDVKAGEATTDEMMIVYFSFLEYKSGDENIQILEKPLKVLGLDVTESISNLFALKLVSIYPNPTDDQLAVSVYMPISGLLTTKIIDISGLELNNTAQAYQGKIGFQTYVIDVKNLEAGSYRLLLNFEGKTESKLFIKY
jgi:hypothetical protein